MYVFQNKSVHNLSILYVFMLTLEYFETRTTRTPEFWGYPPPPSLPIVLSHIGSQVKRRQSESYKLKKLAKFSNKHYMRHTIWSCLVRCANMKWTRRVLLKIQSGHDSVHRRTDGWTDRRTSVLHIWYKYQVKLDAPHSALTYLCSQLLAVIILDRTRWNQYTPLSTSLKRGV